MINKIILAIIIFLSTFNNYSMHEKNNFQPKNDYGSSISDDAFSSSEDVATLSKEESECKVESSYKAALRDLFSDYDAQQSAKTENKEFEDSKAESTKPYNGIKPLPIIPYSPDDQSTYSESRETSQRIDAMRHQSNHELRNFSKRSAFYADRDATIRRYLGRYNQLSSEDQKKLAQENPKLHKAAMKQVEIDNLPPVGQMMKENLQAIGESIASLRNKIGALWGASANSTEHNRSEKISSHNEYLNATAEQNRNAHHNDYKRAVAEQQRHQNNRYKITKENLEHIKKQALAEQNHEKELQKSIELENENRTNNLNKQLEVEQSKRRLEDTIRKINAPRHKPPKIEPSKPRYTSSNYMEATLDSLGQSHNSSPIDSAFNQKESALGQDKKPEHSTKENISSLLLQDAIDIPAKDLITTGRQETQRIDPKIIEALIADPQTPKKIVALLEQTNELQNSTHNPELNDLSTTTTELILFAETISKKLDEVNSTRTKEESEHYNTLKETMLDIASTLNQYVSIAIKELEAKRIENFEQSRMILEQPIEVIKASTQMLGEVISKLAIITAPYDPETVEMMHNISPNGIAHLQKKSDEEVDKIVSSVKQSFSNFKELPSQEKFRAAVSVSLNLASQILVAKACSQLQTSLQSSAAQTNALKAVATTTEEIAALEEAAQIISQEQKLIHAVEQAAESNLANSAEKLARTQRVNEILDAATEFSQSEKAKEILSKLDKRSGKNNPLSQENSKCPPSCVGEYDKLKQSLAIKEITSVVDVTEHGLQRLLERGFTGEEIISAVKTPDITKIQKKDCAKVCIKKINDKYNVFVINEDSKKVVSALRHISEKSLNNLAKNYDWVN